MLGRLRYARIQRRKEMRGKFVFPNAGIAGTVA
jgi:hypothetical protein